jgi:hypothetical protein
MNLVTQAVFKLLGVETVSDAAKKATGGLKSFVSAAGSALTSLGGMIGGVALGAFFKKAVDEALEGRRGIALLGEAVDNAGGNFAAMRPQIEQTVDRLATFTTFTDDEVRAALANMVTATGDVDGSLKSLGLVADLAAAKQIPLEQASQAVAMAMNGNTKALEKMIGPMRDGADVFGVLGDRVGGTAEKMGKELANILPQITKQLGENLEAIGNVILGNEGLTGGATKLVEVLTNTAKWIEANADKAQPLITALYDIGQNIYAAVVPAFQLLAPTAKLALGVVTFSIETATLAVRFFTGAFQTGIGLIAEKLGSFVEKGAGLLRKFGIDVSEDSASSLKRWGEKMLGNGMDALDRTATAIGKHVKDTVAMFQDGETQASAITEAGTTARVAHHAKAADRITKTEKKALEEQAKDRERAWQQLGKDLDKVVAAVEKAVATMDEEASKAGDELLKLLGPLTRTAAQETADALENVWQRAQLDPRVLSDYEGFRARLEAVRGVQRALAEAQDASRAVDHGLPPDAAVARLDRAIALLRDQATLLKQQYGDSKALRELEEELKRLTEQRTQLQTGLNEKKSEEQQTTADITKRHKELFDTVVSVGRAAGDFALAMGAIDEDTASTLTSFLNIGEAIAKVSGGDLTAIPQLLGGISSVIARIVQGDPERKRIIEANSAQLRRLNENGVTLNQISSMSGEGLSKVLEFLSLSVPNLTSQPTIENSGVLMNAFAQSGVSPEMLDAVAKEFGLTIRDSKGRLITEGLEALLAQLSNASTRTPPTATGRLDALRTQFKIENIGEQGQLAMLGALLGDVSPAFRGVIDATDLEGSRARLRSLFDAANRGDLATGDLGKLSPSLFRSLLLELFERIDTLAKAPTAETASATTGLSLSIDAGGGLRVLPGGAVSLGSITTDAVNATAPTLESLLAPVTEIRALLTDSLAVQRDQLAQLTRVSASTDESRRYLAGSVTALESINAQLAGGVEAIVDRRLAARRQLEDAVAGSIPRF